jgi:hypothetical protein
MSVGISVDGIKSSCGAAWKHIENTGFFFNGKMDRIEKIKLAIIDL